MHDCNAAPAEPIGFTQSLALHRRGSPDHSKATRKHAIPAHIRQLLQHAPRLPRRRIIGLAACHFLGGSCIIRLSERRAVVIRRPLLCS